MKDQDPAHGVVVRFEQSADGTNWIPALVRLRFTIVGDAKNARIKLIVKPR